MTDAETRDTPIDARLVVLNTTHHYSIDAADRPLIAEIRSVYLYDKNEMTHLAELSASYYLIHLYDEVVLTPEADAAIGESAREAMYAKYETPCGDDPNIYVHCRQIDAIEQAAKGYKTHGETGVSFDDTTRDEQLEALREHYCANQIL